MVSRSHPGLNRRREPVGQHERPSKQPVGHYLPHVEGTRAIAVLLVVVYHVFTEQTAGAVDVFFVLTGFLVVSSLLRRLDRGLAGIKDFLVGLFIRLAPVSLVVLLATYIGSLIFLSPVGINLVHREIIASALYLENWQLIIQGSDYLAREEPPTPVLHFWAMSVQMQFYLGTALVFALLAGLLLRRFPSLRAWTALTGFFSVVFVGSLAYSVYVTYFVDEARAYFDTTARAWEFAMGALLGLAMSRWPRLAIHSSWGWLGIAGLFAAGAMVAPVAPYPGFAALVPTVSTVLIILAGQTPRKGSAGALLSTPVMVSLGGVAYTLYLVHWPLLIFYREYVTEDVGFMWAVAIIALSIALSYVLRFGVEKPLLRAKYRQNAPRLLAVTAVPLLAVTVALPSSSIWQNNSRLNPGDFIGTAPPATDRPGLSDDPGSAIDIDQLIPPLEQVRGSRPDVYSNRNELGQPCMAGDEVRDNAGWCVYGVTEGYEYTVALLGASHSAHWLPALEVVADQENWRILTLTAIDCNFVSAHPSRDRYENCDLVSQRMINETVQMRPDAVFTVANEGEEEVTGEPRLGPWRVLNEANIPVFALRDNPWFDDDPSSCVADSLENPAACRVPRDSVLSVNFELGDAPENVVLVDLTNQWCGPEYCPAVVDNLLLWRDTNHFTVEFSRTLAPALRAAVSATWEPRATTIREDVVAGLLGTKTPE
jgi:peptidoglycan/LPS O-acetylase OafA/YrhL